MVAVRSPRRDMALLMDVLGSESKGRTSCSMASIFGCGSKNFCSFEFIMMPRNCLIWDGTREDFSLFSCHPCVSRILRFCHTVFVHPEGFPLSGESRPSTEQRRPTLSWRVPPPLWTPWEQWQFQRGGPDIGNGQPGDSSALPPLDTSVGHDEWVCGNTHLWPCNNLEKGHWLRNLKFPFWNLGSLGKDLVALDLLLSRRTHPAFLPKIECRQCLA